jgi:hypothetical protein
VFSKDAKIDRDTAYAMIRVDVNPRRSAETVRINSGEGWIKIYFEEK